MARLVEPLLWVMNRVRYIDVGQGNTGPFSLGSMRALETLTFAI